MKEALINNAISTYLQILENQGKLIFQRNNSFAGYITRANGSNGYIKNNKIGSPDFYVFIQRFSEIPYEMSVIALEVKNEKGKQNKNQKEFQRKWESLGGNYFIVRDVETVFKIIQEYLT